MADEAHDTDIQSQIKSAIFSRSSYFQDQADSLTFEKVRRLLEKDLGLETHALDIHKRFVKHWLQTCIESASPENLSKSVVDTEGKAMSSTEEAQSLDKLQVKNEVEEPNCGDVETMEDSPVMGLMTGLKKSNTNDRDTVVPTETTIKKAIWARASYIRENSESITLARLRRLLEEDLATEKCALDPFKKFISQQVDEVLNAPEAPQTTVSEKKSSKSSKEAPTSSGNESDEAEEEELRVKKRSPAKKRQKTEAVKKRQRTEEKSNGAKRKRSKVSKSTADDSGEEGGRDASEDENSDVSAEKPVKKKDIPKPSYGKEVERLKSVIKSCGMSISPAVYKKVKQAPENKREACLKKELEEILSKEGISTNPSEKEIKDVKKRKERAKELEGIDLSNIIVSSSRRRSTTSFIPPPKPKIPDLSESESEESDNDDDDEEDEDEDEGDEEVENKEADEDQENGGNSSQSEESDKGNSDSD